MKEKVTSFVKDFLWIKDTSFANITLDRLEQKMREATFERGLIKGLLLIFEKRIQEQGERAFQHWLVNLHFKCPDEFQNEEKAIQIYDTYYLWLENEVTKLEIETKLRWEEQTEDIKGLDEKARKTQLVIRHRLSEIVLELM
ncbi:hypothetical protein [Oceanobacillus manasiensis]|uniref:hypothetical protein n=1 Tax=Oceanobacillus manasiensis TaxID=586413 RepID=UPI0005A93B86|nr:hypothetical protein [Oceanobacillus manasiensis]